jgi:maleate cis-trans isomerase
MQVDIKHRLGVLVPSSNTTVETELREFLPRAISMHVGRLPLTQIAESSIVGILEPLEAEAIKLAAADVDLIVLAATAPSFIQGAGYDKVVSERITTATGKPALTTSTAMVRALRALGAQRITLGSAFTDDVNAVATSFLEANGFCVAASEGLGYIDNLAVGRLGIKTAFDVARTVDRGDTQALLLACTNWVSMAAIEELETELGKPVISTAQATLWAVLRELGWRDPVNGAGRLLRDFLS